MSSGVKNVRKTDMWSAAPGECLRHLLAHGTETEISFFTVLEPRSLRSGVAGFGFF
jgi:hypothetical protein